jgi:hypothetical protein
MNLLWYFLVGSHRGGLSDIGKSAALTQLVEFPDGAKLDVSLYVDELGHPHFVRVRAFDATDVNDTGRFDDHVHVLAEHMLSVLKLTWEGQLNYSPFQFFADEGPDGGGISISIEDMNKKVFPSDTAQSLFAHTMEARQSLRLIADSLDPGLPHQYRFLSLYKFLEIRYKNDSDCWDWDALKSACASGAEQFAALKFDRDLIAELIRLRDSCAHIKSGKDKKRQLGVTALHPKALRELRKFMPVLTEICREVFNKEMEGKISLGEQEWMPGFTPSAEE